MPLGEILSGKTFDYQHTFHLIAKGLTDSPSVAPSSTPAAPLPPLSLNRASSSPASLSGGGSLSQPTTVARNGLPTAAAGEGEPNLELLDFDETVRIVDEFYNMSNFTRYISRVFLKIAESEGLSNEETSKTLQDAMALCETQDYLDMDPTIHRTLYGLPYDRRVDTNPTTGNTYLRRIPALMAAKYQEALNEGGDDEPFLYGNSKAQTWKLLKAINGILTGTTKDMVDDFITVLMNAPKPGTERVTVRTTARTTPLATVSNYPVSTTTSASGTTVHPQTATVNPSLSSSTSAVNRLSANTSTAAPTAVRERKVLVIPRRSRVAGGTSLPPASAAASGSTPSVSDSTHAHAAAAAPTSNTPAVSNRNTHDKKSTRTLLPEDYVSPLVQQQLIMTPFIIAAQLKAAQDQLASLSAEERSDAIPMYREAENRLVQAAGELWVAQANAHMSYMHANPELSRAWVMMHNTTATIQNQVNSGGGVTAFHHGGGAQPPAADNQALPNNDGNMELNGDGAAPNNPDGNTLAVLLRVLLKLAIFFVVFVHDVNPQSMLVMFVLTVISILYICGFFGTVLTKLFKIVMDSTSSFGVIDNEGGILSDIWFFFLSFWLSLVPMWQPITHTPERDNTVPLAAPAPPAAANGDNIENAPGVEDNAAAADAAGGGVAREGGENGIVNQRHDNVNVPHAEEVVA